MNSSNILSTAGFRAFPPEIREMIFHFSNSLLWTGKTPALVVALRGDQQLYREVLELFCKKNVFRLHNRNDWKTGDMAVSAIRSVRALDIEFWSSEEDEDGCLPQVIEPTLHSFDAHPILHAEFCRSVHFNVSSLSEYDMSACLIPAVNCARRLPGLQHVTIQLPKIYYHGTGDPYDTKGCIGNLVGDMNQVLGMQGKLCRIGTGSGEVWFWERERGWSPIVYTELRTRVDDAKEAGSGMATFSISRPRIKA